MKRLRSLEVTKLIKTTQAQTKETTKRAIPKKFEWPITENIDVPITPAPSIICGKFKLLSILSQPADRNNQQRSKLLNSKLDN